jgi:TRAP-type C4-dicarboxylate transport system substrate-binding protein
MSRATVLFLALAVIFLTGCGAASKPAGLVLAMESPDPAGIEHDPAVAYFVNRVAQLSGGLLRIEVDNVRPQDGSVHETSVLRVVARGAADLGWAHTRSFGFVNVHAFDALDAPMLIDNYRTESAVIGSGLATSMLAGVNRAGLTGLALLAGPLNRLIGTRTPLRGAGDIRGHVFALRRSSFADMVVRALGGRPVELSYGSVDVGLYTNVNDNQLAPPAFLEDDLDSIFFDRRGSCPTQLGQTQFPECGTSRPWVMANAVLGASPEVIVANPGRLRRMSARQRSWLMRAAADAARYSTQVADRDARLVPQLCAAGVRFATASPATVASLRRALQPLYASLKRGPAGPAIRRIATLGGGLSAPPSLRIPSDCQRQPRQAYTAHGVRSSVPDGVYRIQVTAADIAAAGAQNLGVNPGVETLTLRNGHWLLSITEPGDSTEQGTYAGTPLRTAWFTDRPGFDQESFYSIAVSPSGLRFHIVQSWDAFLIDQATYGLHTWRRIGG